MRASPLHGGTNANAKEAKTKLRVVIMNLLRQDSVAEAREIFFVRDLGMEAGKRNGFPQGGGTNDAKTEGGWFW